MTPAIKAIFFDIDGTLLSYNTHSVLPGTIKAFEILHAHGIRTFISSGRPKILIPPLPVQVDGYITVNGGLCLVGDEVLLSNPIADDDARRWLDYVEQSGITTMCFTADKMYINRIDPETAALRDQLGFEMPPLSPLSDMRGEKAYQFIAMQPAERDATTLRLVPGCRMPRWHPAFSDVIPADSSKAVGIERMLSHFGIRREETMAFGDGNNDIEMLEYVEIGVAMGNANNNVKSHADYVTDTADSEGIAKALAHFGLI